MKVNIKKYLSILLIISLFLLVACNKDTEETTGDNGERSLEDTLNIAMGSEPPNLDAQLSTHIATRDVARQIFESLVTYDNDYNVVPMLAESFEQSEDGKTFTFKLREGVKFHNGKEMTSKDVVASMNRWLTTSNAAKVSLEGAKFKANGDYTVTFEVENPAYTTLSTLANVGQMAAIMPKEVIDSASANGINEYIGTGPFKFVEWKQDQNIHLSKNKDYQSLDIESNGLAGKKDVFINDIYFHFVPDTTTQITGIQTGQYDLLLEAPYDNYELLVNDSGIKTSVNDYGAYYLIYNKQAGVFKNLAMREAINTGVNIEEIFENSFSHEDIYVMDSSYMPKKYTTWYSETGKEAYNQNDAEKAKNLLNEAGYNGEPIKILSTREYTHIYNSAVVLQQQLENMGVNVELELYDFATVLSKHNTEPEKWDIFITGLAYAQTPIESLVFTSPAMKPLNDSKFEEMVAAVKYSQTEDEAKTNWGMLQEYSWVELPVTKMGDFKKLSAFKNTVVDYKYMDGPILWNTKITK